MATQAETEKMVVQAAMPLPMTNSCQCPHNANATPHRVPPANPAAQDPTAHPATPARPAATVSPALRVRQAHQARWDAPANPARVDPQATQAFNATVAQARPAQPVARVNPVHPDPADNPAAPAKMENPAPQGSLATPAHPEIWADPVALANLATMVLLVPQARVPTARRPVWLQAIKRRRTAFTKYDRIFSVTCDSVVSLLTVIFTVFFSKSYASLCQ